jgi:hypothetical protein
VKPRLLDLCCKAGGAAKGYQRAGFHVVGVDKDPQPNYCGDEFHHADALAYLRWRLQLPELGFDAVHASPEPRIHSGAQFERLFFPRGQVESRGVLVIRSRCA